MGKDSFAREPVSVWATFTLHEFVDLSKNSFHVEKEIKNFMGDVEVFLPFHKQEVASRSFYVDLFEGYAFVRHDGKPDFEDRARGVRGSYVDRALRTSKGISFINGEKIYKYKDALKEMVYPYIPEEGDIVEGVEGVFRKMVGVVLSVDLKKKTADVKFKTRTREVRAKDLSFIALALRDEL